MRPVPRQFGQVRSMVKKPCCARTLPSPEQVGHVSGFEPASAPVPLQASQASAVGTLDLRRFAVEGFFERDLQIVAQIAAAILTAAPLLPAHELAEQIVENIGEGRGEIEAGPLAARRRHCSNAAWPKRS